MAIANKSMLEAASASPAAPSVKASAAAIANTRMASPAAKAIIPCASLTISISPSFSMAYTNTMIAADMARMIAAPLPLPRLATLTATARTVIIVLREMTP